MCLKIPWWWVVPGHASGKTQTTHEHADLNHNRLPDTVELELQELYRRLEKVEKKLAEKNKPAA